jgi:hypothetical protein
MACSIHVVLCYWVSMDFSRYFHTLLLLDTLPNCTVTKLLSMIKVYLGWAYYVFHLCCLLLLSHYEFWQVFLCISPSRHTSHGWQSMVHIVKPGLGVWDGAKEGGGIAGDSYPLKNEWVVGVDISSLSRHSTSNGWGGVGGCSINLEIRGGGLNCAMW